ncbi:MAG: ATP synthase subunit I [bacterium]|nr:ATP synthase subunit I [bacterium]
MSDNLEPAGSDQQLTTPPRNERILVILAVLGVGGSIAGAALVSARFGLAVLIGCVLAFVNYYWMQHSLKKIFSSAVDGKRPRFLGAGYFIRYLVLGCVVAFIYTLDLLPISGLLVGMAGFGFAILVEGFLRVIKSRNG